MKRNNSCTKVFIFCIFIVSLILCTNTAFAVTIHVPSDYATIQAAINEANSGDTVQVAAGTYYASYGDSIPLKSGVTLQGAGADITTITRSGGGSVTIVIGVNNSTIDGFTISDGFLGIFCDSASPTITNCVFTENYMAIVCENSSSPIIVRNTFLNNGSKGVDIYSSSPMLSNNIFIR